MLIMPLNSPKARYCPSLVQLQQVTRADTLCLETDFCSGDHSPFFERKKLAYEQEIIGVSQGLVSGGVVKYAGINNLPFNTI